MGRVLSSQDAVSLQELKASAFRCRTPKQFRTLLNSLQTVLPYQNLFCGWGYPANAAIGFFYNHSYPREFMRWYLTKGMLRDGPVFHEWLRTNKAQVTVDVMRHMAIQFDPELLERVERLNLQYTLGGGLLTQDHWVFFAVNMDSEQSCRTYLKRFQVLVPMLCHEPPLILWTPLRHNAKKEVYPMKRDRRIFSSEFKQRPSRWCAAVARVPIRWQRNWGSIKPR